MDFEWRVLNTRESEEIEGSPHQLLASIVRFCRDLDVHDALHVIWAHEAYLQRGVTFPTDVEAHEQYLSLEPHMRRTKVSEWMLASVAQMIMAHARRTRMPQRSIRSWSDFASLINTWKLFEETLYAEHAHADDIHFEMTRMFLHQFFWQGGLPVRLFARYSRMYNDAALESVLRDRLGLSADELLFANGALFSVFNKQSSVRMPLSWDPPFAPFRDAILDHIRFLGADFGDARSAARAGTGFYEADPIDLDYPFRRNRFFDQPLVLDFEQNRISCPLPRYLFVRGLLRPYYQLGNDHEFMRAFGGAFERYIGDLLSFFLRADRYRLEPEEEYYGGRSRRRRTSDWTVAAVGEGALFLECKALRPPFELLRTVVFDQAKTDAAERLGEAVAQAYRKIIWAREERSPVHVMTVGEKPYPVIVTLEDWWVWPETYRAEIEEIAKAEIAKIGEIHLALFDEHPWVLFSAANFEVFLSIAGEVGLFPALDEVRSKVLSGHSAVAPAIDEVGEAHGCHDRYPYDREFERVLGVLRSRAA